MPTLQRHKGISKKIEIPRSVPGLVTRRLLVMNFLDGVQITRLGDKTKNLSRKKRKMAVERIVHRVAEAYGRQLLYGGLFQADGHPGNILVMKGNAFALGSADNYQASHHLNSERCSIFFSNNAFAAGPLFIHICCFACLCSLVRVSASESFAAAASS